MAIKFYIADIPDGYELAAKHGADVGMKIGSLFDEANNLKGQQEFMEIGAKEIGIAAGIIAGIIGVTAIVTHIIDKNSEKKKVIELENNCNIQNIEINIQSPNKLYDSIENIKDEYKNNINSEEAKEHYIRMMLAGLLFLKEKNILQNSNINIDDMKSKLLSDDSVKLFNKVLGEKYNSLPENEKIYICEMIGVKYNENNSYKPVEKEKLIEITK